MIPQLTSAEYVGGYVVRVRFADGVEGDVDLRRELYGEVFEPLKSTDVFQRFHLDSELNTISWPCGADFAPEFLYERAARHAAAADSASRRG
jgi:hypothetical protein